MTVTLGFAAASATFAATRRYLDAIWTLIRGNEWTKPILAVEAASVANSKAPRLCDSPLYVLSNACKFVFHYHRP